MNSVSSQNEIERRIVELGPWHLDVDVTQTLSTKAFLDALPGTYDDEGAKDPRYISFMSPKPWWTHLIERIYPGGLEGRRFLDCACNCGGYCFWSKELGASECFGFDVRDHWIRQAEFLKENRIWPSDGIEFRKLDLYDLPSLSLDQFHLTLFSGIFYHLPDPITGLKAAADLTSELLVLSTEYRPGLPDGMLAANFESRAAVMSGVYELCWWPTGPKVLADVLRWLGFAESRVINWLIDSPRKRGRLTIAAARDESILKGVQAIEEPTEMPRKPSVTRAGKRP
ncbi:MAG: class I SAM-dependent methyltransferase [Gammaproteobacteria bacterium]